MRSLFSFLVFGLFLANAALVQAGTPCRDFELKDRDSGEVVKGCASLSVDSNKKNPPQLSPALVNHKRFGWKIVSLNRGSILAGMGLRPGDVLLQVNEYNMAAQETPAILGGILGDYKKLSIVIGQKASLALSPAQTPSHPAAANTTSAQSPAPNKGQIVMQVTKGPRGLTLNTVEPGSYFASIGVQAGDTLLKIAGQNVTDLSTLSRLEKLAKNMDEVHVIILRAGTEMDLMVKAQ